MVTIVAVSEPGSAPDGTAPTAPLPGSLIAALEAVEHLGACSADYDALSDAELIAGQRDLARLRGLVETRSVWLAKTLAHRSRRELGQQGLAARQGFLSPADLIQTLTGSTRADARKLVDVGAMLSETETAQAVRDAEANDRGQQDGRDDVDGGDVAAVPGAEPVPLPWYSAISDAVAAGTLSVAAAHAIRAGLGTIDVVITAEVLGDAVQKLLTEAKTTTVDDLLKRSRRMRDTLDEAGIAKREQKAWDDRYLRIWTGDSGQVHLNGQFPPEQGAFILSVCDSAAGPRRGGVRFVDPDRAAWAKAIQDDPRSTDQLTADTFVELLRAGSTVNPHRMLGGRSPAVRILTPAPTPAPTPVPAGDGEAEAATPSPAPAGELAPAVDPAEVLVAIPDGSGHGFIEGNPAPVCQQSVDRIICTSGTVEITFDDDGQPLNLGREERIFTAAQRIALAARDGGCRWGDCDRPPSRTEAHHLEEWVRDHGATDIRVGILLCPPHHRLLHAQGWQIFENRGVYWLRPPAIVDPGQSLIRLNRKSPIAPEGLHPDRGDRH
ncbi:HNH endonuclease signature motif containing protein [Cryobacterium sp. TMT4-31]|uniref:HNH endonuclease signature motif containing protein n=1 Tax=Cryobacterium sp. TMT4-31 TaxID=1259259 RepID=UPI00106A30A6|nr:HNH endonuclease signature motif containing protein [Cryobacterium sp. TMT4-31]TFC88272.1 HNH endonuclease [Cryobacterium sp. TMT4-31]